MGLLIMINQLDRSGELRRQNTVNSTKELPSPKIEINTGEIKRSGGGRVKVNTAIWIEIPDGDLAPVSQLCRNGSGGKEEWVIFIVNLVSNTGLGI